MTRAPSISQISAELTDLSPADPIFFQHGARKPHSMHIDRTMVGQFDGASLCCVLNKDTEFRSPSWPELRSRKREPGRKGTTIQVCEAEADELCIWAHPDFHQWADEEGKPRLFERAFQNDSHVGGFIAFDYWRKLGYTVDAHRASPTELRSLPKLQVVMCGHFTIADLYLVFHGQMLMEIDQRVRSREIVMERRLVARQKRQDNPWSKDKRKQIPYDFVRLPVAVTLNGACTYQLELSFIDSAAVHGPISFGTLCQNVNINLLVKDEVKDSGLIMKMDEAMYTHYDTILKYLDDDKRVHEALRNHRENTAQLFGDMNVKPWWDGNPPLTVGKATQKLFQAVLEQHAGVEPGRKGQDAREELLGWKQWATADHLASYVNETIMLLAKVEGGRCRSNRPTVSWLPGPIADIDISGCYGKGLALQTYPIGQPLLIGFPLESPRNAYPSLEEFLLMLEDELVPGLWHARVSLPPDVFLDLPQDFLGSWFDYRIQDVREQLCGKTQQRVADLDDPIEALDVRSGCLKILRRDIQDAVITHDFVEWLRIACSPAQRQELLSKLEVKCALIYPKHDKVDSLDQLRKGQLNHQGRNRFTVKRLKNGILDYSPNRQEYHGWYGINLGELLVNQMLNMRNGYDKTDPMNALLKLYINSLYGDSVSPYFSTSDMCVGNNVTARARAMAWYLEKSLYTVQTITDGGQFELNGVLYAAKRRLTAANVQDLVADPLPLVNGHIKRKPLGNCERIDLVWTTDSDGKPVPILCLVQDGKVTRLEGKKALQWIDHTALAHLRQQWPGASVLDSFTFETKMVYDRGSFHGSANYLLEWPGESVVKMRSYERKQHYALDLDLDNGALLDIDFYQDRTPAYAFLSSLFCPSIIPRQHVFAKSLILKDGDYRVRYEKVYQHSLLHPGCTIWKVGLLRECSLSQYTFDTVEQFKAVKRQWELHKNKYGQFIEALFSRGKALDYAAMIVAVHRLIASRSTTLMEDLDPSYNTRRSLDLRHPAFDTLALARVEVAKLQGIYHEDDYPTTHEFADEHAVDCYDHKPAAWFDYEDAAAD
jgi:hypothetical protein